MGCEGKGGEGRGGNIKKKLTVRDGTTDRRTERHSDRQIGL